jgi:tricorn protease
MRSIPTAVACLLFSATTLLAVDIHDTRLLSDPAVSSEQVAFSYANDLWVANLDGSGVRRLTSHPGIEANPRFSPDGRWIAFSGEYDGNTDVFIVSSAGGVPRRLTWHPGEDIPLGFTPDGTAVLFTSPREVHTMRYRQLFTVPVSGGAVSKLPIPNATEATYSPDGSRILYQPLGSAFHQWKNYRGGRAARLLLFDNDTYEVEQIPQPEGGSNDTAPMWIGESIYFLSDRDGEFNLYSFDPRSWEVRQLTRHSDFPIVNASAGGGRIVFERAGYLHLFDPASGQERRLAIGVAADLNETRPRFVKGAKYARSASLSPSGARAAFDFRGEIITVPAEKGDERNLTASVAAHDRFPAWSPDGTRIAWFSDESGEYALKIGPQDGEGAVRTIALDGGGFYAHPRWSPDGTRIAFSDNSRTLYVANVSTGVVTKVSSQPLYSPGAFDEPSHSWSPDSQWLAYVRRTPTNMGTVQLYSLSSRESHPLTDGMSNASEPVFDPNGKYLYFIASTDAGPVEDWFSMSNADMVSTSAIYLAVLPKGEPNPLAKESDEEEGSGSNGGTSPTAGKDPKDAPVGPPTVRIDLDGLSQRIVALPVDPAGITNLQVVEPGRIHYLSSPTGRRPFNQDAEWALHRFNLEDRKSTRQVENVDGYELSRNGEKVLLKIKDDWIIAAAGGETIDPSKHKLPIDAIEVKIDPVAEWRQIFDEAWRINRDYFYDPNFHGADWEAMREKYAEFLPHLTVRQDLNRVLTWLSSELAVGHHRVGGGDSLATTETTPGGLLGADYDIDDGRYRFKRIYGGLNWNPELRAPLTEPGVEVRAGEYLLAVNGKELRYPENLHSMFERTAGRITQITVGPRADGRESRTVRVVPIESETALRNRDWVEGNLRKVTEATGGRVAYVYVPNTTTLGHEYFKRYFFPQANRDAIIVDERHNGGGQVADYYIDILRRPFISNWAMRYGADLETPLAAIHGPKVMLIDETAGSGGDLLPWMFRELGLGPLIGKRTWGGLVGILGFPTLMDGGSITAPNLAIWTEDGFIVENVGVAPDIEVEQTPADVIAGRDPQLERAIEVVLRELEANPPRRPVRPPFPLRAISAAPREEQP